MIWQLVWWFGGTIALGLTVGYFFTWWVLGHEPLFKRNCNCGRRH